MNETKFTDLVNDVVKMKMTVIDAVMEELVEPLENLGNPEQLIGKKYETWTPQDFQMLGMIYGAEPNALSKFIFNKEYKSMKELEQGV